ILQYTAYAVLGFHEKGAEKESGYDCGKVFFTDQKVQEVLHVAVSSVGRFYLQPYIGRLYGNMINYFTLPIQENMSYLGENKISEEKIWHKTTYQVVMDSQGGFIDVIVRTTKNDFTKCLRVDDFQINEVDQNNGYQCGEKFISTEDLLMSAKIARKHVGKGFLYPKLYESRLYDRGLGLVMWPIYKGTGFHRSPKHLGGPYFILVDPIGQVIDVVVRTIKNDFVRCFKSRNILSASSTDVEGRVLWPKNGFTCNHIFFSDSELNLASGMAKDAQKKSNIKGYPLEYNGPPFNFPCLLWPITPSGIAPRRGRLSVFRLVLSPTYKVLGVIMQGQDTIKRCERTITTGGFLNHDKNDYNCGGIIFYQDELVSVAKVACKKIGAYGVKYPLRYDDEKFDIEGPYFIYPIIKGTEFVY
ncbi:hypothetical protein EPUL_000157, partial [Erysiphe pulchra]